MQQRQSRPSENELLAFLKSNYLFEQFSDNILQEFLVDMEWVSLQAEDVLFRQNDSAEGLYLVYHGELSVVIVQEDGSEIVVAEVGAGKPLGEIQFLSGGARTANVYAKSSANLLRFSKAAFDRLAEKNPDILTKIAWIIRQRLRRDQLISMLPAMYGSVDSDMLNTIESELEWVYTPQGECLFEQGDPGDSFFMLVSGRLQAFVSDKRGAKRLIGEIRRGEMVGEMAMFTGDPRSASIYAVRNSELVKFSKQAFERILTLYPKAMLHIMEVVIKRIKQNRSLSPADKTVLNIAVIPGSPNTPLTEFTIRLVKALSPFGETLHLNSARFDDMLGIQGVSQTAEHAPNNIRFEAWLDEQEAKYTSIIYEADMTTSPWTKRCIHRADQILIIAQNDAKPVLGDIEDRWLGAGYGLTSAQRILVLLHDNGNRLPSYTGEWLALRKIERHHHVRWNGDEDIERLGRFLRGKAVGLVLGGGGARGLSHIGVIRALQETGIPIDMIGGTSIGAAIAAQYAMGMTYDEMLKVNRKIWIDSKPFHDYTLPVISIIRGKKFEKLAEEIYGKTNIEDLWINYFCISTNLTTTEVEIHQQDSLAKALRATASLPGIAVPLVDGGDLLVDGGVLNNLPGDIMRDLWGGTVIAVNVSSEKHLKVDYEQFPTPWRFLWDRLMPWKRFQKSSNVPNIFDLLMRTTMVSSVQRANAIKHEADLYLQPPVDVFKFLDFRAIEEIAEVGYKYAKEKLTNWKAEDSTP